MIVDVHDGQMIFEDLMGLKLPDIRLTGQEKPEKNLTQETRPDRESNPCPLCGKRACYRLLHSGGQKTVKNIFKVIVLLEIMTIWYGLRILMSSITILFDLLYVSLVENKGLSLRNKY